ncbi:hypothetical protein Tco_0378168 [Tanacetum coccineum]
MFHSTLHLPLETLDNPFIAPVNIEIIESFMQKVSYQGVVDKVSTFNTKFLAQPWQTMFKANDPALWDVLKRKFKKSSTSNTSCRDDDFHSQYHDDHQEDDAPSEGEKRQQYQQQEWDAWEEETIIDKDEVIPKDETPELITEFHNVDKRMSHPEKGRNIRRNEGLIVITQDII